MSTQNLPFVPPAPAVFFLIDVFAASVLAGIREQLALCRDLPDAGVEWSLDCELIDIGAFANDQPVEKAVATVAAYVKKRLKARIRKGETLDELQENTRGGR